MKLPKGSPWNRYRFWNAAIWVAMPAFVLSVALKGQTGEGVVLWVSGISAITSMIALQCFKCPRCGSLFFKDETWYPWRSSCVHCGLPKWMGADHVGSVSETEGYQAPAIADLSSDSTAQRNQRFLTLVLRDDPGAIHLTLDSDGWADVTQLLTRSTRYGFNFDREELVMVIERGGEPRFELDPSSDSIRISR